MGRTPRRSPARNSRYSPNRNRNSDQNYYSSRAPNRSRWDDNSSFNGSNNRNARYDQQPRNYGRSQGWQQSTVPPIQQNGFSKSPHPAGPSKDDKIRNLEASTEKFKEIQQMIKEVTEIQELIYDKAGNIVRIIKTERNVFKDQE
uniref:Uncharacterized protein n=1 Tax=Acrobeloides nanus TaxID=290746 RepID=A0A914C6F1_9BILA